VNQAALEYTGYTKNEIIGLKVHQLDPNVNERAWPDIWNELKRVKNMRFETIHRTKEGVYIPFEVTASHIVVDKSEEYNFALVRNISERRESERKIKMLSQAVEHSPASVVITDVNGTIEYVNRKFSQVTGYTREEAIGNNPRILKGGYLTESYYINMWNTILDGREWQGEFQNRKKSGELYSEAASISPVMDENGKIAYFVAVKEDITERKIIMEELKTAREKAESATQAKSDFLATMSHEIRTPMNAIMGMCHLAIDTELTDTQYGYLTNIQSAADSLLSIINDILDLSKVEAGKMEFESVEFEWNKIIEKVFNVLKFTANEKKLELIYSFGRNIPKFMVGDPTRLSQVIMNLVGNAIKYTPSGEVTVHTELVNNEDQKRDGQETIRVRVTIRDTGIGISQSKIASLFTPFTQVDSSITRRYGGTGLGLVIARRIVNKMGGDIEVASLPGKGSTFSFTVLLNKIGVNNKVYSDIDETNQNKISHLKVISNSRLMPDVRVMVVEPNASARRALSTSLRSLNMRVMAASKGDEAIQLIELTSRERDCEIRGFYKSDFDMVFINADLPHNSISCVETLRAIERSISNMSEEYHKSTKYIVMHDFKRSEQVWKIADLLPVHAFLPRPITPVILIRTILDVTGRAYENNVTTETLLRQNRFRRSSIKKIFEKFKDKLLLVVDDDAINRQIVLELLKKTGIENIQTAANGDQAVRMAQEQFNMVNAHPFDLILMDVEMPVMDGLEATRQIRELGISVLGINPTDVNGADLAATDISGKDNSTLKEVPIIALTGHALDEYREKCFKAGMNDHIDKPIDPERLFHMLQKWLIKRC